MKRSCYFYNIGTMYDKNNKQEIEDCWNSNPNNCKSDNLNGLWCDNYGAVFNEENVINILKNEIDNYLKCGVKNAYAYYKKVDIDLPESECLFQKTIF